MSSSPRRICVTGAPLSAVCTMPEISARQPEQACLFLVDLDVQRTHLLVPVQLRIAHQRALGAPGRAPGTRSRAPGGVGPEHAELHRKAHRRPELQSQHARRDVWEGLVRVEQRQQLGSHTFALLDAGGHDHELRVARIGQLRQHRQVEARRAGAGVGGEEFASGVLPSTCSKRLTWRSVAANDAPSRMRSSTSSSGRDASGKNCFCTLCMPTAAIRNAAVSGDDPRPAPLHAPVHDPAQPVVDGRS